MTGRARLAGQTRRQIMWGILRDGPLTVRASCLALREHGIILSVTAADKLLRAMFDQGYLLRSQVKLGTEGAKGCHVYLYRTTGHPPPDGRVVVGVRVLAEIRKHPRLQRARPVDHDDDEDENWGRGRCARKKGTPAEIPAIPSLGLLASGLTHR